MADIVMEKQYLSLTTKAPTANVYGFGENIHRSFRHQFQKTETWAMLARDQPPGQDPNQVSTERTRVSLVTIAPQTSMRILFSALYEGYLYKITFIHRPTHHSLKVKFLIKQNEYDECWM